MKILSVEATDMGNNQQDIANKVDEIIGMREFASPDEFYAIERELIDKACKELGWLSVPQCGGLTPNWDSTDGEFQAPLFTTGYLFKPTHTEVHFLKRGYGVAGDEYKVNFSTSIEDAETFASEDEARDSIYCVLLGVDLDDEYEWTPVIADANGSIVKDITPMFKIGSSVFRETYKYLSDVSE